SLVWTKTCMRSLLSLTARRSRRGEAIRYSGHEYGAGMASSLAHLDLVVDDVLGLELQRPRDPEALLSEEEFARDEFLPYWAELWPSALELAAVVEARELRGMRVLELGCGLGVPSLVAARAGALVLA